MAQPTTSTTSARGRRKGGGVKTGKRAGGEDLEDRGSPREGSQPSPSLSPAPGVAPLEPWEGVGRPASTRRRDESGHFVADESEKSDLPADVSSVESWMSVFGAREMEFFSRRARSGKDPAFTHNWMRALMGVAEARAKAIGAAKAADKPNELPAGPQALFLAAMRTAAREVDEMDEADLVAIAGGLDGEGDES